MTKEIGSWKAWRGGGDSYGPEQQEAREGICTHTTCRREVVVFTWVLAAVPPTGCVKTHPSASLSRSQSVDCE